MATFRVGMRVARKAGTSTDFIRAGMVGTIMASGGLFDWQVLWDDPLPAPFGPTYWWHCPESTLAPLTDPKEEQWAADKVKQVTKPLMVERPVYTKERA